MIETFNIDGSHPNVGPYSQGVRCSGEFLFVSGQIGITQDGSFAGDSIESQTRQVFANIRSILSAKGYDLDTVVKATVLLADIKDYAVMNTIYMEEFGKHRPARAAYAVAALPKLAKIEIEVIACTDPDRSR
jgi:2-iminobutanoate/2-iminopropanoate deaminase